MKGRLESLENYLKGTSSKNEKSPYSVNAIVPVLGHVIWFDIKGEPHRVIGFALCLHARDGMLSFPIVDMPYDLPMIDDRTILATQFGFPSIFYDEVPMDDVVDNFILYRKYGNSLEDRTRYIERVAGMGVTIK